jgi:hypothetical protein
MSLQNPATVTSVTPLTSGTGTTTSTVITTTAAIIVAANVANKGVTLFNALTSASAVYVLLGTGTVSATNYSFVIKPGGYWDNLGLPFTGAINAIVASGTATLLQTVLT